MIITNFECVQTHVSAETVVVHKQQQIDVNSNFHCRFQTHSDTCFSRIMCRLQDDCYSETTSSQHDKIKLHSHIKKKK